MTQLLCRDLRPGDVMIKMFRKNDLAAFTVSVAQFFRRAKHHKAVHAGLMFDSRYIIESQGPGINANDLRLQNKDVTYTVLRCRRPDMARGAGTCAKMLFDIHQRRRNETHTLDLGVKRFSWKTGGPMSYSAGGAIGSIFNAGSGTALQAPEMDALLTDVLSGRSHRFFCSQLVIYIYQFVAVQCRMPASVVFPGSDAKVDPSMLWTKLAASGLFDAVGVMAPGVR